MHDFQHVYFTTKVHILHAVQLSVWISILGQGGKYLLGQLGTDLKGHAKFDLLRWQDKICLSLGFVAGLECITW